MSINLKGKFAEATILIDDVPETVVTQIYNVLNHIAFDGVTIRIMPDCHAGVGCVVGFTATPNQFIIPNLIGVDIGCGMLSVNLGKLPINLEELDDVIHKKVPSGTRIRETIHPSLPDEFEMSIIRTAEKIEMDVNRAIMSIGTLGGGNHFIELGVDPDGNKWLTVHSGSRKFGESICRYHQRIAKQRMKEQFSGASAYNGLEFLHGKDKENYIQDMMLAAEYARINRFAMIDIIISTLGISLFQVKKYISCVHNFIGNDGISRKGAISAYLDEPVIIPFNMKDGILFGKGKGNPEWNYSAPHGAGRVLSRTQAKNSIVLEDFEKSMEGIYTTSVNKSTLDESPSAYKDMNIIMQAIEDTVSIDFIVKPIYNFKDS